MSDGKHKKANVPLYSRCSILMASPALRICEQASTPSVRKEMVDIYLITGPTGKRYVGQAKCVTKQGLEHGTVGRFRQHCSGNKKFYINQAIQKHGAENFKVETLATVDRVKADAAERFAIVAYNSLAPAGYNLTTGGAGVGWYHNNEMVEKMSLRMTQEWASGKRDLVIPKIAKLATGRAHQKRKFELPLYIYQCEGKKTVGVECRVPGHPRKAFTRLDMPYTDKVSLATAHRDGILKSLPDLDTASNKNQSV